MRDYISHPTIAGGEHCISPGRGCLALVGVGRHWRACPRQLHRALDQRQLQLGSRGH